MIKQQTYYIPISVSFCNLIYLCYLQTVVRIETFVLYRYWRPHFHTRVFV